MRHSRINLVVFLLFYFVLVQSIYLFTEFNLFLKLIFTDDLKKTPGVCCIFNKPQGPILSLVLRKDAFLFCRRNSLSSATHIDFFSHFTERETERDVAAYAKTSMCDMHHVKIKTLSEFLFISCLRHEL